MRLLSGCTIFVLWTVMSSSHCATRNQETQIQSRPKTNQAVAMETAAFLTPLSTEERSKRQHPADATTTFVGLRIRRAARSEDYARVKEVARRVHRPSTRTKRSLDNFAAPLYYNPTHAQLPYGPTHLDQIYYQPMLQEHQHTEHHHHHHHKLIVVVREPPTTTTTPATTEATTEATTAATTVATAEATTAATTEATAEETTAATTTTTTPAPPTLLTETQETFNVINRNLTLSRNLREEYSREIKSTILAESGENIDPARAQAIKTLIVVRQNGVTCNDVCSKGQAGERVAYGTLGICTPRVCRCDYKLGRNTRIDCPADMVFDPISLSCKSPFNVILCNDENSEEPKQTNVIQQVMFVPKYILTTPVITPVADSSVQAAPEPYFLHNSLGNTGGGGQTFASPPPVAYSAGPPQAFQIARPTPVTYQYGPPQAFQIATPTPVTYNYGPPQALQTATSTPSPFSTVSPRTDSTMEETQGTYQVSPESSPFSRFSNAAAPISQFSRTSSSHPGSSPQFPSGLQNQLSHLGPLELQLLHQLLSQQTRLFDQHSNQQGLSATQPNLQRNPALSQSPQPTQHSALGSASNVIKRRACESAQTINCPGSIETVKSLELNLNSKLLSKLLS